MFPKITPKNSKTRATNRVSKHYTHISYKEQFYTDFCTEIDLYSEFTKFPEWIDLYREEMFSKISRDLIKVCHILKNSGIEFKIKYPIKIDGRWKFADIYIPKRKIVIIMLRSRKEFCKPVWNKPERSSFFRDRMRVVECYEYECDTIVDKISYLR